MRGIILAGGSGSRLHPLTVSVSKQLLPVYNKPLIYYPLSTLLLAGTRDIAIITSPRDRSAFMNLLGDGHRFGVNISYLVQESPDGIAKALLLAENFLDGDSSCLALGDNILYGSGVGEMLSEYETNSGATILAQTVADPERYGVVELDEVGRAVSLEEKPTSPKSSFAVPGLYFYDSTAVERAKSLTPSTRGELEITDLNKSYLEDGQLNVVRLPRGTVWLDTGTVDSLSQATEFVKVVEQRQGTLVGSPEEIAWRMGYIKDADLTESATMFSKTAYGVALRQLVPQA